MKNIKFKYYGINIDIKLQPGLYRLVGFSGEGKTFLFSLMREYEDDIKRLAINNPNMVDPKFLCVTYNDYLDDKQGILDRIKNKDVIFFDRYDLYNGFAAEELTKQQKNSIILLEFKDEMTFPVPNIANINVSKDSIEVYS